MTTPAQRFFRARLWPTLTAFGRHEGDCCYHHKSAVPPEPTVTEQTTAPVDVTDVGTVLAQRYRLERLIGEGGMGRVFLAHDRSVHRDVAVKVLTDDRPIPNAAARFQREVQAIARIEHEHVVRITDVGESPRGGLFYVMEFLVGEELADTVTREGRLPWVRARDIALQVCDALQAAHEAGVVHRDLKLENCFRVERHDREGRVDYIKILDFGVAKLLGPDPDGSDRLTNTGATLGTPAYMAPELCRGRAIDHRVDVYALGVMLYELLTGHQPFVGEGFVDVAMLHMNEPPPPLSRYLDAGEVVLGVDALIGRAMAKSRDDRFPTMAAFARALHEIDEHARAPVPKPGGTEPALAAVGRMGGETAVASAVDDPVTRAPWVWGVVVGVVTLVAGIALGWMLIGSDESVAPAEPEPEPEMVAEQRAVAEQRGAAQDEDAEPVVPSASTELGSSGDPSTGEPMTGDETAAVVEPEATEAEPGEGVEPAPAQPRRGGEWTRRQIEAALRSIRPRTRACVGGLTGGRAGDRVRITLTANRATGKILSVKAKAKGSTSAVEACVAEAVRRAQLPRVGRGTQRVVHVLTL